MMSTKVSFYRSSVGQKILVALTGLFLCTFLVVHLTGNLLLFKNDGGEAFEAYAGFMSTNVGIRTMEIVLAAGFLIHILMGVRVWLHNRRSRPEPYVMNRPSENSQLASRLTFFTGSVVFIFLVVHLNTFFLPTRFPSEGAPPMFELVKSAFSNPFYVAFYLIAMYLLGFHLRQGFQSAFQTFGLRPGRHRLIDLIGLLFWLVIPLGFAAMPIYFLWIHLVRTN